MMRISTTLFILLVTGCVSTTNQANRQLYDSPSNASLTSRLIPWTTIAGYMNASSTGKNLAYTIVTGDSELRLFKKPVGVSVNGDDVFIIDGHTGSLNKFSWNTEGHDSFEHISDEHDGRSHPALDRLTFLSDIMNPTDIYVTAENDIYISDGNGQKVVRYTEDGEMEQIFKSKKHLNHPVAVTVDRRLERIFVADGFFDHVIVFNSEGKPVYRMGRRGNGAGEFRNIRSMIQGRMALYIIDGMNRRIQVFGLDGTYLSTFAKDLFNDGAAITVDDENRFYVIDRLEHNILVFRKGELLETFGTRGKGPGEFDSPSDIWFSDGFLYVADTNNGRIQVIKVLSEKTFQSLRGKQSWLPPQPNTNSIM